MLPRAVAALVAYVPGTGFFAGEAEQEANRRSLRLSYCYPEPERIQEGVRRLGNVIDEELEPDRDLRPVTSQRGAPTQR